MVTSLVICPYTSYWQPNQPTYNPVEACVQLYHSSINEEKPYYESPRFRVAGSMMVRKAHVGVRAFEQMDCTAAAWVMSGNEEDEQQLSICIRLLGSMLT